MPSPSQIAMLTIKRTQWHKVGDGEHDNNMPRQQIISTTHNDRTRLLPINEASSRKPCFFSTTAHEEALPTHLPARFGIGDGDSCNAQNEEETYMQRGQKRSTEHHLLPNADASKPCFSTAPHDEALSNLDPNSASFCHGDVCKVHNGKKNSIKSHVCNIHSRRDTDIFPSCPAGMNETRVQQWASDMDVYLAASRLCREEAMECSMLLTQEFCLPRIDTEEEHDRKNSKNASSVSASTVSNRRNHQSWRGLHKLFSRQFMPFSIRDYNELYHVNTAIDKRLPKTLTVMKRNKCDVKVEGGVVRGVRKVQGKENARLNSNQLSLAKLKNRVVMAE